MAGSDPSRHHPAPAVDGVQPHTQYRADEDCRRNERPERVRYAPQPVRFPARPAATIKPTHCPSREHTFVIYPRKAPRDRLAIGFNPEAMRDVAGRPSPRGSRRRVLFGPACCTVGGAMFGNQSQGRIFVGTSADALPISVDDPLMTNVLDCIFCHCGSTVRPPARLALA